MSVNPRQRIQDKIDRIRQELLDYLNGLDDDGWQTAVYTDPLVWQVSDTVRHLVHAEKGMTRLMMGLREGQPGTPEDFDLAAYNQGGISRMAEQSREELMAGLMEARSRTTAFMAELVEGDWEKAGRHPIGRVLTIAQICELIGLHEQGHFNDIQEATNGA